MNYQAMKRHGGTLNAHMVGGAVFLLSGVQ